MIQEIYIIDDDESSLYVCKEIFKNDSNYKFISVKSNEIDEALKNIPSVIIINEDAIDVNIIELCKKIRNDEDECITPIIVVSSNSNYEHRKAVLEQSVEYYLRKPLNPDYLYLTIKNLVRLLAANRIISPLTGLPGNVQIHAELKKRLMNKQNFSVLYLDLDNFKAYNDVYGFLKGDEIIKYTANTISNCIHSMIPNKSFIGHIGGDDFIAIIPNLNSEEVCEFIIDNFKLKVNSFYCKQDIKNGYIEVENRKGIIEKFPLLSISIGVVEAHAGRFKNILEIGEVGAQIKHLAKSIPGNSYSIDRRKE